MKTLKYGVIVLLLIISSLLPLGCGGGGSSDLPVQTIAWEDDGNGYIQYYTNDRNNCSTTTGTYISKVNIVGTEDPMTTLEVEVIKINGFKNAGFGVLFCSPSGTYNYYKVDISIEGYYKIRKVKDNTPTDLVNWKYSSSLKKGYSQPNKIKIERSDSNIYIYFNNTEVYNFIPDPDMDGGDYGFVAGVAYEESFPNTPVDIRFKKIQPVSSQAAVYKTSLIDTLYQSYYQSF